MRIISSFRDYYDGVVAHGSDRELCYVRETRELEPKDTKTFSTLHKAIEELYGEMNVGFEKTYKSGNFKRRTHTGLHTDYFDEAIIGFCGKLYPAFLLLNEWLTHPAQFPGVLEKLHTEVTAPDGSKSRSISDECYRDFKKQFEAKRQVTKKEYVFRRSVHKFTREWFEEFVARHGAGKQASLDFFFELNAPVFVWLPQNRNNTPEKIVVNPCLKDYRFQSLVDPFTAWQELSMFLGGVLQRPENRMVAISDEIRRDKKGFDDRSFKNMQRRE